MADSTPQTHSPDRCLACRIATLLAEHRDTYATGWTKRRGTLNFAILIAQRECPAHQQAWSEVDA